MGELLFLPVPKELSPGQREHWEQTLENAERLRENALRMLGRLPLERGLDEPIDLEPDMVQPFQD